ncbi:hypothetical protein ACFL6I_25530, partial [candidate division KSB1 bacterium]
FLYFAINKRNNIFLLYCFFSFTGLLILIWFHSKLISNKKHFENLIKINKDEIKSLDGDYLLFNNGQEFIDHEHPYTTDLDIFGQGSFFQYINRTATIYGKHELAFYLSQPDKDINSIILKQQALKDLSKRTDFRQNFQARGMGVSESMADKQSVLSWLLEKGSFDNPAFNIIRFLIPLFTIILIGLSANNFISWTIPILMIVIQFGITGILLNKVNKIHNQVSKKFQLLKKYSILIGLIEKETFHSELLKDLQLKLAQNKKPASKGIKKLANIVNAFDTRLNLFAGALLNGLFLWDIHQCVRLSKWKKNHHNDLPKWFDVIGSTDALNSLANYAFNHPDYTYPIAINGSFILKAVQLGHPLIKNEVRINNDVNLNNWKQFNIITGANMAGKSTWLRTIGLNLIIGMTGAPACAQSMTFHPINLFTSLRTNDSLMNNESYFYAELKRLQSIIQKLEKDEELFILLDEILKGTNSKDKQKGSVAFLKQLIRFNAAGMIATHDISIGELEKDFPEHLKNLCFEVDIKNDQLFFDYKLREGISKNLNATFLMKKMGITLD